MTMITATRIASPDQQPARLVIETLQHWLGKLRRLLRLRRDRRQLRELPDRLLKDIGITRSEIDAVTRYGMNDPTRRLRV